ncbi:LacI family DNA-binding transcriptional regulator [Jiangella mangrovi]|uniref:DNA-binding LacI/PurR family transcriptional regulator n=1 Tax=Jiangella mangrovi TaxID=1524084 RepID=A0A7W9LPL2_9ACTN|nr:LacI family DNA-binding transcriptional regulator [Jiangella mangrovi]MBB5791307.1 DNA-binding LacI/PurR family transcriptional regulator [Jiangella mangrovi]
MDDDQAAPEHTRRPTIKDVADRAGVTKATVSKYLNRAHGYAMAASTRERIRAAIQELDFEPSPLARGLTRSATSTIGLVVADIRSQFYPDLVASIQAAAEAAGYTLVLGSSGDDPHRELDIVRSMAHRRVDGVVLVAVRSESDNIDYLRRRGIQIVLASRDLPELVADTVVVDSLAGGRAATRHLVSLGHRRLAHVAGEATVKPFADRRRGFELETAGLGAEVPVAVAQSSIEGGRAAALRLLDVGSPPTGIFFASDTMALGGLMACADLGLRVPDDVSIVGFDNVTVGQLPGIGLTTIDSDAVRVGELATELLLKRIPAPRDADPAPTLITRPAVLVERTSAARPRA